MPSDKEKPDTSVRGKQQAPVKPPDVILRLATLLEQEQIPEIEAKGFLAGAGLKPTDRMTRSAFQKRFRAWRNQPAGGVRR